MSNARASLNAAGAEIRLLQATLAARDAEIATLQAKVSDLDRLADVLNTNNVRLDAENDGLRTVNDGPRELVAIRDAEIKAIKADLVWAAKHGANAGYDGDSHPAIWYEVKSSRMTRWGIPVTSIDYDGTDPGLLAAVRAAREESRS